MIYASVLAAMEIWDSWPSEWWEWIAIYSHCIVAAHRPTNGENYKYSTNILGMISLV